MNRGITNNEVNDEFLILNVQLENPEAEELAN